MGPAWKAPGAVPCVKSDWLLVPLVFVLLVFKKKIFLLKMFFHKIYSGLPFSSYSSLEHRENVAQQDRE